MTKAETIKLKRTALDWVDSGPETVILDESSENYFATNPAGSVLWRALETGSTIAEMADLLVAEFGIGEDQARQDTAAFVDQLKELDMIDIEEPTD